MPKTYGLIIAARVGAILPRYVCRAADKTYLTRADAEVKAFELRHNPNVDLVEVYEKGGVNA